MKSSVSVVCKVIVVAATLLASNVMAGEAITVDEESPEYKAMMKTWRAFRECTNKGDYKGAKAFVRLEGHEENTNKSWPEHYWQIQASVLAKHGKIDLERFRVRTARIKHGPPKRGHFSAVTYYAGTELGRQVGIHFVFIDGTAYITKL